jgi:hypothetical protein
MKKPLCDVDFSWVKEKMLPIALIEMTTNGVKKFERIGKLNHSTCTLAMKEIS